MKKMKRFFALFLAMAMVLGMSMTTFAAEGDEVKDLAPTFNENTKTIAGPTKDMTGTVTISGKTIQEGKVTFTAYQLIGTKFNGTGETNFVGYKWNTPYSNDLQANEYKVDGSDKMISVTKNGNTDVVAGLTSTNINKWAANATSGTVINEITWGTSGTGSLAIGTASMDLKVGTWMIIATPVGDVDVVYNPMIVSVYYRHTSQGDWANGGNVNADGKWELVTTNAYQKSTDIGGEEEKKVGVLENGTFTAGAANAEVGKPLNYQLTGRIPSYAPEYFATVGESETTTRTVNYTLKDSKNAGLEYVGDVVVKVNGSTISEDYYEIKWYTDDTFNKEAEASADKTAIQNANAFTVKFTSAYIESLAGTADTARDYEVTYSAKITDKAVENVAENKYKVDFTRTPGGPDESTDEKTVYSYTAAINGAIQKVDEANKVLGGAEFELYSMNGDTKVVFDTATTSDGTGAGENGSINFEGLEFGKTYYLAETKAPDGYSINTKVYEIVCSYDNAKYDNTTEKLTEYTVSIKDPDKDKADTVTVPYGGSATILSEKVTFVNTTLSSLPSTGGIGTTIFTVGGCAIMILAAGMFFVSRRRAAK